MQIDITPSYFREHLTDTQRSRLTEWLEEQNIKLKQVALIVLNSDGTYYMNLFKLDEHEMLYAEQVEGNFVPAMYWMVVTTFPCS